jgi:hypothetical protein
MIQYPGVVVKRRRDGGFRAVVLADYARMNSRLRISESASRTSTLCTGLSAVKRYSMPLAGPRTTTALRST